MSDIKLHSVRDVLYPGVALMLILVIRWFKISLCLHKQLETAKGKTTETTNGKNAAFRSE